MNNENLPIDTITVDDQFRSVFDQHSVLTELRGGMLLTTRIDALNFRLRESAPGYEADWHVAGDPTLIAVQQGTIRILLRNGDQKEYNAGDAFIAKDYLPSGTDFDDTIHGHRAAVVGDLPFKAIHIKLDVNN